MVFTLGPSAHLLRLATRAGLVTIFRSSGIFRFVQGGVVNTFRCTAQINQMDTELVTATQVFELAGGRVVIADEFFHDFDGRAAPFDLDVVVVTPDGDRVPMTASISQPWVHSRPPRAPGFVCTFENSSKSSFPIGSRIVLPSA